MNIKKYYKTYRVIPPDYFYIENAGDGENTLSFYQSNANINLNIPIYYSFDTIDWQLLGTINKSTLSTSPLQINHTGKIFLRANTSTWGMYNIMAIINTTNYVNAGGNIMSLLYGQDFEDKKSLTNGYTFNYFFKNIGSKLLSVNNLSLPATTLANYCYYYMFENCSSLTTAPDLPATTLANYCYQHMFQGCSSLTTAPDLPATTLADYCYQYMFFNCKKLNYIKFNSLTAPGWTHCDSWVTNVPTGGTFVKNPAATWENTFGTSAIPTGWTVVTE